MFVIFVLAGYLVLRAKQIAQFDEKSTTWNRIHLRDVKSRRSNKNNWRIQQNPPRNTERDMRETDKDAAWNLSWRADGYTEISRYSSECMDAPDKLFTKRHQKEKMGREKKAANVKRQPPLTANWDSSYSFFIFHIMITLWYYGFVRRSPRSEAQGRPDDVQQTSANKNAS